MLAATLLLAGCGGSGAVRVSAAVPTGAVAAACDRLVAALPERLVTGAARRPVRPVVGWTAAFGSPAISLACGSVVPPHDPSADVEGVNGVDWLEAHTDSGAQGGYELFASFRAAIVVVVRIPDSYLPADVLTALSPLVLRFS